MFNHLTKTLIITMSALLISGCLLSGQKLKTEKTNNEYPAKYLYYLKKGDVAPSAGWLVEDDDVKLLYREATK